LLGSVVVIGEAGRPVNRSILIDADGAIAATYDKMHLFDLNLADGRSVRESDAFAAGASSTVAKTPWGRLGLTICYDVRFPYLYRSLGQRGAALIAVPAAFTRTTGRAHWEVLVRARAIETGAYVLAPAQGGEHEDGRRTWGRSMAVGPSGEVLAATDGDDPWLVLATVDLDAVRRARADMPAWAPTRHEPRAQ
jgi:deaminated glutathione amidase